MRLEDVIPMIRAGRGVYRKSDPDCVLQMGIKDLETKEKVLVLQGGALGLVETSFRMEDILADDWELC